MLEEGRPKEEESGMEKESVGREDRKRKGHGEGITQLRDGDNRKNRAIKKKIKKEERMRI